MYRGFELDIADWDLSSDYESYGVLLQEKYIAATRSFFKESTKKGTIIDGNKIIKEWFPKIDADIFLSHSHKDEKSVKKLAGWLYKEFGIKTFIDSTVWKYSNLLLKEIDNVHCKNTDNKTYNYDLRNNSTTHIHLMLSTALTQMIDHCETFFLVKTNNSITTAETIKDPVTFSPWIYSELVTSGLIRKKELIEYGRTYQKTVLMSSQEKRLINETLQIAYTPDRDHLTKLTVLDLKEWLLMHKQVDLKHPLGHLYELKPFKELKLTKL